MEDERGKKNSKGDEGGEKEWERFVWNKVTIIIF